MRASGRSSHRGRCSVEDLYLRAFLDDYISRECCHACPYAGVARVGDITLADFWGYVSEAKEDRNDEKGISLVLVNSVEGKRIFNDISPELKVVRKTLGEARRGNVPLRHAIPANSRRGQFWEAFSEGGIVAVKDNYLAPVKRSWKHRASLFLDNHAYLFPAHIRRRLLCARDGAKKRMGKD